MNLKKICRLSFKSCVKLTAVSIPRSVDTVGACAFFNYRELRSVTLPEGIKTIEQETFGYCTALSQVNLPQSLTEIGRYAFKNCKSLTVLTLPKAVTKIGDRAFQDCEALSSITLLGSKVSFGGSLFYNVSSNLCITTEMSSEDFKKAVEPSVNTSYESDTYYGEPVHREIKAYFFVFSYPANKPFCCTVYCKKDQKTLTFGPEKASYIDEGSWQAGR